MNPAAYVEMAEVETRHWWFVARRRILGAVIESLALPPRAAILEVGCGTGGNLAMLGRFGQVSALEMDANARALAASKTGGGFDIRPGCCPHEIPFQEQRFDLICLFDVLEHIDEDTETLSALRRLLAPGGRMLITVPAYQWLWSGHDEFLHHKRRYSAEHLRKTLTASGMRANRFSYFNTLLFPLVAMARSLDRLLGRTSTAGSRVPVKAVNGALQSVFASEQYWLARYDFRFGLSLLCVLEPAELA